jgi:acetyl esterase/lipase
VTSPQLERVVAAVVAGRSQLAGELLDVPERRRRMEAGALRLPAPPDVAVEAVEIGGVPCEWIRPIDADGDGLLLYFHGGGYAVGGLGTHRNLIGFLAAAARVPALSVGYRLAPEHPYPAAVDDAVAVLSWLSANGTPTSNVVVAGDSAGGGLAAAMCVVAREHGWSMPRALVLLSPWLDMAATADDEDDALVDDPIVTRANLRELRGWYLGNVARDAPLASPARADVTGFPPTLIQVGSRELLRADAVRFGERLRASGTDATCEVWDGMIHVWQFYAGVVPEADEAIAVIAEWLRTVAPA